MTKEETMQNHQALVSVVGVVKRDKVRGSKPQHTTLPS